MIEVRPRACSSVRIFSALKRIRYQTPRVCSTWTALRSTGSSRTLSGYREELVGQLVETLVPESFRAVHPGHRGSYGEDPVNRPMGAGLELTGLRRDGTQFPVDISLSSVQTKDGLLVTAAVRDVTQQREAFEAAARHAAIVESSDDAIIGKTLDGLITSWNAAAARMYGYSSQEIIGKSIELLSPKDRTGEIKSILAKIRAGQPVEQFETVRVRKDGMTLPVSLTVSPIRDADDAIIGACAITRDITAQRQAFATAQRMEAIVQSSDDAIISSTLDRVIRSWNPAAERMFGYSSQEMIGTSAKALTPKDRIGEIRAILTTVGAGQTVEHLETVRVRKDGTVFPVSLTVSPIRDADGAIVGTSVIARDMTEQQRAARYARDLIEAGLDPLVTISPQGKITDVNEATVKVTGIPRDALIGTDFSQYFTDPDKAHEGYARAFAQGFLTDYPLTLVHQDGTLTDVLYNASVYRDVKQDALGVLAVARDAAKLRQQQQLSEQLQEALKSRIVIEQAKGITAQRHGVTIEQAYQLIRAHARNNNTTLRTVAEAIVQVGLEV
jgi:PAS domain S-box-containing protein